MKLNKKQKRTATIASMAALLAVVLGMGGQTFAKYISTKDVAAQATVAKWGFVINTNMTSMFAESDGNTVTAESYNGSTGVVTSGATATNVKPGDKGNMSISFTGQADVDATLSFAVTGTDIYLHKAGDDASNDYYPIKWSLDAPETANDITDGKLSEVTAKLASLTANVTKNTSCSDVYTISWKWEYEVDSATNAKDTMLGRIASEQATIDKNTVYSYDDSVFGKYDAKLAMDLNVTVVLEQVDDPTL